MSNNFTKERKDKALEYLNDNESQGVLMFSMLDDEARKAINEQYILPHLIKSINEGLERWVTNFYMGGQHVSFNITGYEAIRKILTDKEKYE
jgi:hypothetical protein